MRQPSTSVNYGPQAQNCAGWVLVLPAEITDIILLAAECSKPANGFYEPCSASSGSPRGDVSNATIHRMSGAALARRAAHAKPDSLEHSAATQSRKHAPRFGAGTRISCL